uniref:Uncharacterized protein MANES_01G027100 n=1 Tax=Rhizophora mucronata TaxID=61149 RepID=A0A2P2ML56_RHIMU
MEEETTNFECIEADSTAATVPVTPDPEPGLSLVVDHSVPIYEANTLEEDTNLAEESSHPLDTENVPVENELVASDLPHTKQDDAHAASVVLTQNGAETVSETDASDIQDEASKKSYASVANALNFKKQPFQRIVPAKPVQQTYATVPRASSPHPVSSPPVEKSNNYIVKGHSIFVANLPMNATVEQLREAFEKFGHIKSDGVQVRSYKQEKNCFGFVEFESADAMESALKVSSIMIGNRKAHIEEKKANGDGGKNSSRRGGFRNENFRNRGNFGGGRANGRIENENRGGFSNQVQGTTGRNGEGNQKAYQNWGGRVPRQAVPQAQSGKN